jgi:CHAT domain-containing protein
MRTFILVCLVLIFVYQTTATAQSPSERAYQLAEDANNFFGRKALPLLDSARNICQSAVCADSSWALIYRRLAVAYFNGYLDENQAIVFADSARFFYEQYLGQEHPLVANQYYTSGIINKEIGKLDEATERVSTAIQIIEGIPPAEVPGLDSILAHWYHYLAEAEISSGDYASGLLRAQKAERINQLSGSGKKYFSCQNLRLIAFQYFQSGNFQEAYNFYEQTASCYDALSKTEVVNPVAYNMLLSLQGICLMELRQNQRGKTLLMTAERTYRQLDVEPLVKNMPWAVNLHALSWYSLLDDNYQEALEYYKQALVRYREVLPNDTNPEVGNLFLLRAKIAFAQEDYGLALEYCQRALRSLSPDYEAGIPLKEALVLGYFPYFIELLDYWARCEYALGNTSRAFEMYELLDQFVSRERRSFHIGLSKYNLQQIVKPAYEQVIALAVNEYRQTGEQAYLNLAWQYVATNKALGLQEQFQQEKAIQFSKIPHQLKREEQALAEEIQLLQIQLYQAQQKEQPKDSLKLLLFEKEENYARFLKELEQSYPSYYQLKHGAAASLQLADFRAGLKKRQWAVEYFWGRDSVYIFASSPEETQVVTQPINGGLKDSISLYYELLSSGFLEDCEQKFIALSHYLYQQLLAEAIATMDPENQFKRLLVISDGPLHLLTFESLLYKPLIKISGSEGFLLEQYALSYLPGSRFLVTPEPKKTDNYQLLGFGLEYDDLTLQYLADQGFGKKKGRETVSPCSSGDQERGLGKLNYSDDEVKEIGQSWAGRIWLNEQATKQRFLADAGQYGILHLAMHGDYDLDYPLNSSLLFNYDSGEDIVLRAAEIYGLDLDAEMVVLSACNTAYGNLAEGEGAISLARAFQYAGSNSTIASLWAAVDYSTAKIMVLFYQNLGADLPKDEALQQAKLTFLNSNEFSSPSTRQPYHWASSIMIGDTRAFAPARSNRMWWWAGIALLATFILLFFRRRK